MRPDRHPATLVPAPVGNFTFAEAAGQSEAERVIFAVCYQQTLEQPWRLDLACTQAGGHEEGGAPVDGDQSQSVPGTDRSCR